jgi:hypothetical protein
MAHVGDVAPRNRAGFYLGESYPLSKHRCCRLYGLGGGLCIATPSSLSIAVFMSWVFAPVMKAERGVPLWSVNMCLFAPSLPLSVGFGPVFPPERRLDGARVERLPPPLDPLGVIVPLEELRPDPLEEALSDQLLEPSVARRPGPILPRKGLPLASRPEHVQYPIEDLPEGDRRPPTGAPYLLLSEERRIPAH